MTTRMQHYVWRHYLQRWGDDNGQVWCLRDRKLFSTNPKNIMVEREFYRLAPFSEEDVHFFKYWLENICEPIMRSANQSTFNRFRKIANGYEIVKRSAIATEEEKAIISDLVIEYEEALHQSIEDRAVPILDQLRQERLEFLKDQESAISFFQFIAHQYFRTQRMRKRIGDILMELDSRHDFSPLKHVFGFCFADNFGGSLFVDRNRLSIVFLRNRRAGYITGDQPVTNLARYDNMGHDDVALYLPLGPNLSVLVGFVGQQRQFVEVSDAVVKQLNKTVAFFSSQFLVAKSAATIGEFVDRPDMQPSVLSLIPGLVTHR